MADNDIRDVILCFIVKSAIKIRRRAIKMINKSGILITKPAKIPDARKIAIQAKGEFILR
ncbi:MAG: hypothetical protein AMJ78_04500 [Omnitrophica WOR_2 bacterium SM23_29]|nr:MAG: hypothetical protein AMJ78_04500 [Omnitrophica WOR_2 bacterium SM23_29]